MEKDPLGVISDHRLPRYKETALSLGSDVIPHDDGGVAGKVTDKAMML